MARLIDGERFITVNGVTHWCKISGSKNNTTPKLLKLTEIDSKKGSYGIRLLFVQLYQGGE
jgi:hypothetical protein